MKNKLNIKILLISMGLLMACSKSFIELEPRTEFTNEVALGTMQGLQDALYGAYGVLEREGCFGEDFQGIPEVASDNVKKSQFKDSGRYLAWYSFSSTSSSTARLTWSELYTCIARANNVINAWPEADLEDYDEAGANQILGEAIFIRAFCHFQLVNFFAQDYGYTADASHLGVPVILETAVSEPARNTVAEVYTQVIADLTQAATLMDYDVQSTVLYATEDAANALLARVYLYKGDWANAAAKANEVIGTSHYEIYTDANYIDVWTQDETSESIFELAMESTDPNFPDRGNTIGNLFSEVFYGDIIVTDDFYNFVAAEPTDVRFNLLYADPNGEYRHRKFPGKAGTTNPEVNNARVIRLSEMYLTRAEANQRAGSSVGATPTADVNYIRNNRGLADLAGTATLDDVLRERRIELAFEGQRLFDLKRMQEDVVRTDCHITTCTITYPNNVFAMPIPETEMSVNSNMVQNPY